jgi:hypothetical protein
VEEEIMDAVPLQCSFGGTTWKTPELTASYFGASSRYEYSTSTPENRNSRTGNLLWYRFKDYCCGQ